MSVIRHHSDTSAHLPQFCCGVSGRDSVEGGLWGEGLDFCGLGSSQDLFRKVTENEPCSEGSTSDAKASRIQELEGPWGYATPPAPHPPHLAYLGTTNA